MRELRLKLRSWGGTGASSRSVIAGIASDGYGLVENVDEGCHGSAGPPGVSVTAKKIKDFEANRAGTNRNRVRIAKPGIDMADIRIVGGENAKIMARHETVRDISGTIRTKCNYT